MKLKVFNKKIVLILLSTVCLLFACFGLVTLNQAKADVSIYYDDVYVRDSYMVNDEFEIPQAMIKEGINYYDATGILTFPSGKVVIGKTVLNEAGSYTLEYRTLVGDKLLVCNTSFNVYETLYSVSGFRSSAQYGVSELAPNKNGIVVSLASGDKLVFNKTINLNKVDKFNKLLSFFVVPEERDNLDVAKVHVTFTDVYDPNNYVTVTAKRYESNSQSVNEETQIYVVAGAKTQMPVGIKRATSGTYYDGRYYQVNTSESNSKYGTPFKMSLKGEPYSPYGVDEFSVSWDYGNKIVYGCDTTNVGHKIIADLDAPELFEDLWSGFTTGEVIMTVHASNYTSSKFNFVITEFYDECVDDNVYVDGDKPVINVDFGEYEKENLPNAILGKPYNIFPATAIDARDGEVPVKTNVYYNYGSTGRINVGISDGKFIPEKNRKYTIVYTATDNLGNVAKEILNVDVLDASYPLSFDFEQDYADTGLAGQKIKTATPIVNSLLSQYKTEVTVSFNGSKCEVVDGYFVPMTAGTYNVSYKIQSYVESAQKSYSVTVSANDQPIFLREPILPRYFIKGANYKIDVPEAVHFSNGNATDADVKVYYKNDNENVEKTVDTKMFNIGATEKVTLIYKVENKGKTQENVYQVPVVQTGYVEGYRLFDTYFATSNATASLEDLGVGFTTNSNDNKIEFINRLEISEISLAVTLNENAVGFGKLDLFFTNVKNNDSTIKVTLKNVNGKTEFSVNDGRSYAVDYSWGDANNSSASVTVDFKKATASFGTRTVTFETDCYGNKYSSNGKYGVDIDMVMCDVSGECGFEINSIGTQTFQNQGFKDVIAPIIITETKKGSFKKGSIITLTPATVSDVLDPYVTYSMYVKTPNDKYAVSTDNVTLKPGASADRSYDIKLTLDGSYMVYYVAVDGSGVEAEFSYAINVIDMTPPNLSVNTDTVYAKVGDSISIKGYSASDETSSATVLITLTDTFAAVKEISSGSKITLDKAGTYTVTYYAYDKENNYTMLSYDIVVEDK